MTQYYKWFGKEGHFGFKYDLTPGAVNHLGNDAPLVECQNGLHYTSFKYANSWSGMGDTLMVIEVLDKQHGLNESTKAVCRAFRVVRPAVTDAVPLGVIAAADAEMTDLTLHNPDAMAKWSPSAIQRFFGRICCCPSMRAQVEEVLGFAVDAVGKPTEPVVVRMPSLFELWTHDQMFLKHLNAFMPKWYFPNQPENCPVTVPQFKRYKDLCWYLTPECRYFLADCGCRYTFNDLIKLPAYIWPQLFSMHTLLGQWDHLFWCSPYDTIEAFMTEVYPLLTNFTTRDTDFTRAIYEYTLTPFPKPDNDSAICLVNSV